MEETHVPQCLFTAALFIIAGTWKQPRCPSADEWIRKLWYIYTMEYHSAIKRITFESILMRWKNLETIFTLTHIYGIYKNGTEEFIYRAAIEKQT